ncbi:MAG TPA: 30S ribosomal protein S20 [Candidatus Portnoybacteria bacterium]|uniref:Small ribosomal subunit protein bS20 n=1 Tax=Candidatus Portnoybacteria bacterium CG02_land_8_20_14_3_00_45_8 TaxID=1974807 RepID=A0A2M7D5Y8_9BACT|nr:MAG: 30S ribosomal protein S20 [Candidatus Portnoybacteria bacterium CG02_land_8_20_14_3_00_45_8]HCX27547.1 30S ribosomal protein S20 [Candidatus Portnoybacteria bacterium]
MPNKPSAKKAIRQSAKRNILNSARKEAIKNSVKKIKKLAQAGKKDEAKKLVAAAYQAIDKAVKRGVIKKNTANRKKSRLMKSLNK